MNKCIYSKKISIYDPYTTWGIILGLTLMYTMTIALTGFFAWKFLIIDCDPSVIILLFVINSPWIVVTVLLSRDKLINRLMLRLAFSSEGIHCFVLGKEKYTIAWGCIHTYGIIGYSTVYISKEMIFFSTNRKELVAKTLTEANVVSQNRVVVQIRPDSWRTLAKFLPLDMLDKLSYSLSKKEDCFHKR